MKKKALAAAFTLTLLFSAAAGTLFGNVSWADPYVYVGEVPPKPDTVPPEISIFSPKNNTAYNTPSVPLIFTVNESVSELKFSLDGQANVTIAGNTTLLHSLLSLPYGEHNVTVYATEHNVTVYATDLAGYIGASETIAFTIVKLESFPTTLLLAVLIASVAVIGIGLLVYLAKTLAKPVFKWIAVASLVVVLMFGLFYVLSHPLNRYSRGGGSGFSNVFDIQEELKPYIIWGSKGDGESNYTHISMGRIEWIGSSDDPVKSIQNIHLIMYGTIENKRTYSSASYYDIVWHFVAYTGNFTLPENILGPSAEIIVPCIGVDNPRYNVQLSVSYGHQLT